MALHSNFPGEKSFTVPGAKTVVSLKDVIAAADLLLVTVPWALPTLRRCRRKPASACNRSRVSSVADPIHLKICANSARVFFSASIARSKDSRVRCPHCARRNTTARRPGFVSMALSLAKYPASSPQARHATDDNVVGGAKRQGTSMIANRQFTTRAGRADFPPSVGLRPARRFRYAANLSASNFAPLEAAPAMQRSRPVFARSASETPSPHV
jgi:hypothetical protein